MVHLEHGSAAHEVLDLLDRFVPRLRALVGEQATDVLRCSAPARWLAWTPPPDPADLTRTELP